LVVLWSKGGDLLLKEKNPQIRRSEGKDGEAVKIKNGVQRSWGGKRDLEKKGLTWVMVRSRRESLGAKHADKENGPETTSSGTLKILSVTDRLQKINL